jgi:hypothetical protein
MFLVCIRVYQLNLGNRTSKQLCFIWFCIARIGKQWLVTEQLMNVLLLTGNALINQHAMIIIWYSWMTSTSSVKNLTELTERC